MITQKSQPTVGRFWVPGRSSHPAEQSALDLSTELTSSGTVNVVTRSGSNQLHGQVFYLFRDDSIAARLPGPAATSFQRNQFGGRLGGAIVKNRLFFFLDAERTKQDLQAPVIAQAPFSALSGSYSSPFREIETVGRLDWQIKPDNYRLFYRFSFDQNRMADEEIERILTEARRLRARNQIR